MSQGRRPPPDRPTLDRPTVERPTVARAVAIALLVALVLAACGSGDAEGGSDPSTTTTAASSSTTREGGAGRPAGYEPSFEPAACAEPEASVDGVDCGRLTVPVDRTDPSVGDVRLPVAIVRSRVDDPLPDPIVYLSGGPGADGTTVAGLVRDLDLGGRRDVILFDQRGTGGAEPSLDCPEVEEAIWEGLATADDALTELAAGQTALAACRARLVGDGVDLDAFDTPTTAADADDLRRALGIETWNLFGISYGTTVAIEVLRAHPEHVRSAVLDSVYPPDVASGGRRIVENGDRAFGELFDACAADPACVDAFGDLADAFAALVADWDTEPYVIRVTDPDTGESRPLRLTGTDLVAGLFNALYDERLIGVLPSLLQPLADRDGAGDAIVSELAVSGVGFLNSMAEGIAVGVDCADRQHLDDTDVDELVAERPDFALLISVAATGPRCDTWDVESIDRTFNALAPTDVPVLAFGNQFDPITPPGDSARTADELGGTFVFSPSLGHGAVFADPCPRSIMAAFVDDPAAPVDAECTAEIAPPVFIAG